MLERLKSTYLYLCWLPLAIYLLADFYIATFEGWGQWAMTVVVLPTMLLSAAFFLGGIVIISNSIKQHEPFLRLIPGVLLAGSVFLGFLLRSILVYFSLI